MPTLPLVGQDFAGYRLRAVLGRGGMSVVYEAENARLGNTVALKVLAPELATDDAFRARFLKESRLAASLNHPNVIPIYDTGPCDDMLYIAMRYVSGSDLRTVLNARGHISPGQALALIGQAGRALDAAHRLGLVHRDVKPANVLIERGADGDPDHVYMADFGLTKHTVSRSGLTATGQLMGTIDYIAPEQIQGKPVDGRADIYSLGCVLYECLTGRVPFVKDVDAAVIWAHVEEPPTPPSAIRAELPSGIDEVIMRALAKDPDDRYSTCREFVSKAYAALEAVPQTSGSPASDADIATSPPTVLARGSIPQPPPQVQESAPAGPPTVLSGGSIPQPPPQDPEPPSQVQQPAPAGSPTVMSSGGIPEPAPHVQEPAPRVQQPAPAGSPTVMSSGGIPEPPPQVPQPPPAGPPTVMSSGSVQEPPPPRPSADYTTSGTSSGSHGSMPPISPQTTGSSPGISGGDDEPVVARDSGAGPPARESPPPRPGRGDHGTRARRRPWYALALLALVAVAAAVVLLSSSSSSTKAPPGQLSASVLGQVPLNHVTGAGSASVRLNGNAATVTVTTNGLDNNDSLVHAMHIHAGGKGQCPPASAARLHNGHLTISTTDGINYYGPPVLALTTRGETSPANILAFPRFLTGGTLHYARTITVPASVAADIRRNNAVVVVHGVDYDGTGIYSGVLERSELNKSVPATATAPALCGVLLGQQKVVAQNPGSPGRELVYNASLVTTAVPASELFLCEVGEAAAPEETRRRASATAAA